jgi:hypothetical protein
LIFFVHIHPPLFLIIFACKCIYAFAQETLLNPYNITLFVTKRYH